MLFYQFPIRKPSDSKNGQDQPKPQSGAVLSQSSGEAIEHKTENTGQSRME